MLNCSLDKARNSIRILEALPAKLDIKRHSPSILLADELKFTEIVFIIVRPPNVKQLPQM